jgi:HSP20 family molecular chaperone IbpA
MTTTNQLTPAGAGSAACEARPMRSVFEPAADVVEKPDALHLVLDMPGVDQKGLEVTVEDHVLRVRGTTAEPETAGTRPVHREFEPGDYERSFRLTPDLDEGRIAASLKNGVLRLVLPKREEAKPRKISVAIE